MNFLSPFVLTGLVSLSVPIIIHQLTRRSRQVRELPTVQFLKQASEHTRSYRRLKEWLLLLLRMLILAALVTAFARPYFSGGSAAAGADESGRRIVLLVDQSASMGYQHEGESLLERARVRADEIIGSNGSARSFTVVGYSDTVTVRVRDGNAEEARKAVDSIRLRTTNTRAGRALRRVEAIPNPKSIVLITDLARHGFRDLSGGIESIQSDQLNIVDVSLDNPRNRWVRSLERVPARPETVRLKMGSVGDDYPDTAELYLAGDQDTRLVELSPPVTTINLPGSSAGGYLTLGADSFPLDRRWFFSLSAPEQQNAFTHVPTVSEPYLEAFQSVNWKAVSDGRELSANGVLFVGEPIESDGLANRVLQFVRDGGRLVLFSSAVSGDGQGLSESILPVAVDGQSESSSGERLRLFDGGGQYFRGLSSTTVTAPLFFEYASVRPVDASRVFATFSSGIPFLVRRSVGNGEAIFVNTSLDASGSDWVTHPLFPVLLHRLVGGDRSGGSVNIQTTTEYSLVTIPGKPLLTLSSGSHESAEKGLSPVEPGLYRDGDRRFGVNISPAESNPEPIQRSELKQLLGHEQESLSLESGYEQNAGVTGRADRSDDDTWQWFLGLAILLMIPEIWLGANQPEETQS